MPVIDFEYKPLEVHRPFHISTAAERAMFGAFGSGKTYGLMAEGLALGLEQPGSHILITRKTVPELRDTTEQVFFEVMPHSLYKLCEIRRAGGHVESCTLPNGTKYIFRSMDDWKKHKSLNLAYILWDEADEFTEEDYLGMQSRIRQTIALGEMNEGAKITRRGMVLATNPNGHDWLWRRFINAPMPGTSYFTSTSFDNPFLPPSFLQQLMEYPEPWIKRYVLCQFDDFAGQVYEEFSYELNMIDPIPPNKIPLDAMFWMGMDPGTRNNTAGLWAYVDNEHNRLVGVTDYIDNGMAAAIHAQAWRRIEAQNKMKVTKRIADPTIMKRDAGTQLTLDDYYRREGFHFQLGPVREAVRVPLLGQLILPRRFVFMRGSDHCDRTAEQIANLKWKELSPQQRALGVDAPEKVLKRDSDLVDCAQYLASGFVKPAILKVPDKPKDLNAEIWESVKKDLRKKATKSSSRGDGVIV